MKRAACVLSALLLLPAAALAQQRPGPNPSTIYGDDDRVDLYQVKSRKVLDLADSTVALFRSGDVAIDPLTKTAALATHPYGPDMGLCKEERFYDQRNGAFCSGSLVGPDLVMTAGHCVASQDGCAAVKFVFGFGIPREGANPDARPAGEVYGCKELVGRLQENRGADWALVRLDRTVPDHKPLALNRSGSIANGAPVFVIGHPAGLPTKVAGGATVRDASPNGFFVANTDTYGGNSGSAVFNATSGLVEGILVRGEQDYEAKGDCRVSKVCPSDGCRGEDVTKIAALYDKIPVPVFSASLPRRDGPVMRPSASLLKLLDLAGVPGQ